MDGIVCCAYVAVIARGVGGRRCGRVCGGRGREMTMGSETADASSNVTLTSPVLAGGRALRAYVLLLVFRR